jgi:uncharacterized protein
MPEPATLTVERNVAARMRDDAQLYADIYRPAGPGPYPTILTRTPYDKSASGVNQFIIRAATAGFAVVVQDVRGRYTSDGAFTPFFNERADGFDTLEWLIAQPWCDGNIGMFGGSYVGLTQWQAAMSGHPNLKAIVPYVTASNYHDGWVYQGGAFELSFNLSWTMSVLTLNTALRANGNNLAAPEIEAIYDASDGLDAEFPRLPLTGHPLLRDFSTYYDDWIDHPGYDYYWEMLDVSKAHAIVNPAVLNIGGWYDIFLKGTIHNFTGMRAESTEADRARHQLLVGPWNHGGMKTGNPIGRMDFGMRSTGSTIDEGGLHLRWYDRWLRGIDNGIERDAPVRVFVMGANRWRSAEEWPLPGTDFQEWYLHSDGRANSLHGDGTLSRDTPMSEAPDSYVYNPRNPVPTMGGGLCCNAVFSLGGAYDQRAVEVREDMLVYTSAALEHDTEVTGPLKVVLYAASSATDTDFTAKLVDVHPCGFAQNLNDGIIRARYRNSMREPELLTPGDVTEYAIDLVATSNLFRAGHRIRLEISSSNFPRFDRNPNTGELPGRSTDMTSAMQTVHHSREYPSRVILPVVERDNG